MKSFCMQVRRVVFLLCGVLLASVYGAQANWDLFEKANRSYAGGQFNEAISGYERLLENKTISSSILFNLGNSYYRNGDPARAVLQYERALLIKPTDPDVKANLSVVQKKSGLSPLQVPDWKKPFMQLSLDVWTWSGALAFAFIVMIFFIRSVWINFSNSPSAWTQPVFGLLFTVGLAWLLCTGVGLYSQSSELNRAIVMVPNASLKVSPFDNSESVTQLRAGESARVLKRYEQFLYIECGSGAKGWIPSTQVESIIPST